MKEKIEQGVAAVVTFGAMLWSPLGEWVNAAGGQAEIVAAIVAVYTVVHGLVVYGHGKVAGAAVPMLLLALMLPGSAMAQEPDRGGVLVDYALGHAQPQDGRVRFEADVRLGATPVLLVGHVLDGAAGVGPRVQHSIGPLTFYGHTLFGDWSTGMAADTNSRLKHGGGVEVPLRDGLILRIGVESTPGPDGAMRASTVGLGWRF